LGCLNRDRNRKTKHTETKIFPSLLTTKPRTYISLSGRNRETEKQRNRETERYRSRDHYRDIQTDTERWRRKQREAQTNTETDREMEKKTER
jgi:hypothetical protein